MNDDEAMIALQLKKPDDAEVEKDYYFTFGCGQAHPNCYVRIHGTFTGARDEMFRRYGAKWSMQYDSPEKAGIERWNLKEVQ